MTADLPWPPRPTDGASDLDVPPVADGERAVGAVSDDEAAQMDQDESVGTVREPDTPAGLDHYEQYRTLLDAVTQVLDGVDRALAQLRDGSYARCSECGASIDDNVLAGDPTAQRCAEHATA